jgi:hypothetical protein
MMLLSDMTLIRSCFPMCTKKPRSRDRGFLNLRKEIGVEPTFQGIPDTSGRQRDRISYPYDYANTEQECIDAILAIPIMMANGTMGPMIPIMRAATPRANVIRLRNDLRWFDDSMRHQACLEEIGAMLQFSQEMF